MKFFHLADIHIGKTVNNFSMLEDQKYIFHQILQYSRKEQPNAIIIAGDVYDRMIPSAEAVKVFDDFLTLLSNEKVPVLIISGNHDSPERLSFGGKIMQSQNIYLSGVFDNHVQNVCLKDEYGEVHFHLLPFIKPSSLRQFSSDDMAANADTYHMAFKKVIETVENNMDKNKRNVLVSHQFFISDGNIPETSESEINPVGGIGNININATNMASCFDYVALGHIHRSQRVGFEHIRYAGSPLKYSLSEVSQKKSLTVVTLKEKGNIEIDFLPLSPLHEMRAIKGPVDKLMSKEVVSQGNRKDYIFVTLTDDDIIYDAMEKMRSVYPNIMALNFENSRTDTTLETERAEKINEVTPTELFDEFFFMQNSKEINPRQQKIVNKLLTDDNWGELL